jgi:hypothetical protein
MKTNREFLEMLPEPIRTKAFENTKNTEKRILDAIDEDQTMFSALLSCFVWVYSNEGAEYWRDVAAKYENIGKEADTK